MPIDSPLNLSLPVAPLTEDPKLAGELQIVYNALNMIVQALNDAGIPAGGTTPSPTLLGVTHGGTGIGTATGVIIGNGTSAFSAVAGGTVGHQLRVKTVGPTTYEFSASGTGDVVGPAGATADSLVIFDGITGKKIKEYVPDANGIFHAFGGSGKIITRSSYTYDGSLQTIAGDYPGGEMASRITNTNMTGVASSNAVQHINVLEANGGSAFSNYAITGTQEWVAGVDTADNRYRISSGVDFVTGTSRFSIDPATGAITTTAGTLGTAAYQATGAFDAAGAAAAVTPITLGLVIGTNVQAYDADLTTWAGVTPGAGVATALAIGANVAGGIFKYAGVKIYHLGIINLAAGASTTLTVPNYDYGVCHCVIGGITSSVGGVTGEYILGYGTNSIVLAAPNITITGVSSTGVITVTNTHGVQPFSGTLQVLWSDYIS